MKTFKIELQNRVITVEMDADQCQLVLNSSQIPNLFEGEEGGRIRALIDRSEEVFDDSGEADVARIIQLAARDAADNSPSELAEADDQLDRIMNDPTKRDAVIAAVYIERTGNAVNPNIIHGTPRVYPSGTKYVKVHWINVVFSSKKTGKALLRFYEQPLIPVSGEPVPGSQEALHCNITEDTRRLHDISSITLEGGSIVNVDCGGLIHWYEEGGDGHDVTFYYIDNDKRVQVFDLTFTEEVVDVTQERIDCTCDERRIDPEL